MGFFDKFKKKETAPAPKPAPVVKKAENTAPPSVLNGGLEICFDSMKNCGKEECIEYALDRYPELEANIAAEELEVLNASIISIIAADGVLTADKFAATKPIIEMVTKEQDISFDDASAFIKGSYNSGKLDRQKSIADVKNLIKSLPGEISEEIILLGIFIAAIDGLSEADKEYFRSILN